MLQIIAFVVIIYKIISYFVVINCYFGNIPVVKGDFFVLMSIPTHILTDISLETTYYFIVESISVKLVGYNPEVSHHCYICNCNL